MHGGRELLTDADDDFVKDQSALALDLDGDPILIGDAVLRGIFRRDVDVALRRYFDFVTEKRREMERFQEDGVPYEGDAVRSRTSLDDEDGGVRVLLFADYTLDEAIIDDLPYMRLAAFDILRRETDGLVAARTAFSDLPGENKLAEAVRPAKETGCRYVLIQRYGSERLKDKRVGYKISLEEALYDSRGNPLVLQGFTTNTDTMTPILAALYNEVAGRESRRAALTGKK